MARRHRTPSFFDAERYVRHRDILTALDHNTISLGLRSQGLLHRHFGHLRPEARVFGSDRGYKKVARHPAAPLFIVPCSFLVTRFPELTASCCIQSQSPGFGKSLFFCSISALLFLEAYIGRLGLLQNAHVTLLDTSIPVTTPTCVVRLFSLQCLSKSMTMPVNSSYLRTQRPRTPALRLQQGATSVAKIKLKFWTAGKVVSWSSASCYLLVLAVTRNELYDRQSLNDFAKTLWRRTHWGPAEERGG